MVIATTQLNRSTEGHGVSRIAYSDGFGQDASFVFSLEGEELMDGQTVKCLKGRDSGQFSFNLNVDFAKSYVGEKNLVGLDFQINF